jgi:hypothetical protein
MRKWIIALTAFLVLTGDAKALPGTPMMRFLKASPAAPVIEAGCLTAAGEAQVRSLVQNVRLPAPSKTIHCTTVDPFALMTQVVQTLTGRVVPVTCRSKVAWADDAYVRANPNVDGYTAYAGDGTPSIFLSPASCADLVLLTLDPNNRLAGKLGNSSTERFHEAGALLVLTHEAGHAVDGTRNETLAECRGLSTLDRAASMLGVVNTQPLHDLALDAHAAKPAAYQGAC